ncbi:MAG: hypothetical protein Q8L71_11685 [Thiobacillus sp.]|nr:hypothetical protein [Thiobacillus sp.]
MLALSVLGKWLRRASPRRDIVLTVLSALAGLGISHLYYVQALNGMKADADERRRVEELVFRGIEAVGDLRYFRDASGKVVGVAIELRGQASGEATATGSLSDTQEVEQRGQVLH